MIDRVLYFYRHILGLSFLLLVIVHSASSTVYFVSPDGDGTDGLTWQSAFIQVGDALLVAGTDDEIWISSGDYVENVTIEVPLTIDGGFSGNESLDEREMRDPDLNPTVLDGHDQGTVVRIQSDTHLHGHTITNGKGPFGSGISIVTSEVYLEDINIIANGLSSEKGGGVYINAASVTIENCEVSDNVANDHGGGLFAQESTLTIGSSHFQNNISELRGSGAYIGQGTATIRSTSFSQNGAVGQSSFGGAIFVDGSDIAVIESDFRNNLNAFFISDSRARIVESSFLANDGRGGGGGFRSNLSSFEISRCAFEDNSNSVPLPQPIPQETYGGSIYTRASTGIIQNSLFITNYASRGSIAHLKDTAASAIKFVNCSADVPSISNVPFTWEGNPPVLTNCIVWGLDDNFHDAFQGPGAPVTYSNIERGYPGEGNINANPRFVDQESGFCAGLLASRREPTPA